MCRVKVFLLIVAIFSLTAVELRADELDLRQLIREALSNNPDIHASKSRVSASEYRIPQARAFPDPMITIGYQNEGFTKFTYGNPNNANTEGILSASQTFPFPGKLALKGESALRESESLDNNYEALRLKTVLRVKQLYFDLYAVYKNIDLLDENAAHFKLMEDAALARYSSGKGSQQEVLMAQTEKYMLLEKKEMLGQKIESLGAMLGAAVGRPAGSLPGRPADQPSASLKFTLDELINIANMQSPEMKAKDKMIEAAESDVALAKKNYYPDITVTASFFPRGNGLEDMWSLTAGITVPIFYRAKQRQAVNEAEASLNAARSEKEALRLMIASTIRDNYATFRAADRLMSLYKDGLMQKSLQDVELALSGYKTGSADALTVITRLHALVDFERSYWEQFAEREKAAAQIKALTGMGD